MKRRSGEQSALKQAGIDELPARCFLQFERCFVEFAGNDH